MNYFITLVYSLSEKTLLDGLKKIEGFGNVVKNVFLKGEVVCRLDFLLKKMCRMSELGHNITRVGAREN